MKKEELIKTIDSIQPDIHMKTRLKSKILNGSKRTSAKKTVLRIALTCFTAAIVLSVGIRTVTIPPEHEKSSEALSDNNVPQIMKAFLVVASAAEADSDGAPVSTKALEVDSEYPFGVHFKAVDIRGLSDTEKENILNELSNHLTEYCQNENVSMGRSMVFCTENYYISECVLNEIRFDLDECEKIKKVNVSNTSEYGEIVHRVHRPVFSAPITGNEITVSGEDFDCGKDGFYWTHNEKAVQAINQSENIDYSIFNDTVTFEIEYIDGSLAIGILELRFDNSGNSTAICKGYEYKKGR